MSIISDRILNMEGSPTIAMSQKSRDLKSQGIDIINLSLGEPDFDTPTNIKQGAKRAIDENYSHYPPIGGYPELRDAICEKLKRENNCNYSVSQILVSNGAKHSLSNLMLSLLNPGDEVIIPTPFWASYSEIVKLAGGKIKPIRTTIENRFKITAEELEKNITKKTKILLYSSPCNPTGCLYSYEELKSLAEVINRQPNIIVISDEIYEHINYIGKHQSIAQFNEIKEQVVIVNGVSKAYAMTGYRIGYIAAPENITNACMKLQGQMTSGASSIAQIAAAEALNGNQETRDKMVSTFKSRRDNAYDLIKTIYGFETIEPEGAFYLFPKIDSLFGLKHKGKEITNANELCFYILNQARVATVTGAAFGEPNCIRLSYACSEEKMTEALRRIKHAIDMLVKENKQ
ncbi:MAG: pyridoxal phosphate-dependent aminotransferase [Marinifilaceae bacterium]|jgi:aspartate aminotransferase|nr:pyridoxal phosphate-dependent aminotransferase [Marinifilaceae bacterium]